MLANYSQVSQHKSADNLAEQQNQAIEKTQAKKNNQAQAEQKINTASVVNISFEAELIRQNASEIMQGINLTKISQNQLDSLTEHLYQHNVINSQEYATLSFFGEQVFNAQDSTSEQLRIDANQPQDMIGKWQDKLQQLQDMRAKPIAQQQAKRMVNLLINLQASA
ncbi:hypothetical protein C2869_18405 [Saccharobesus litoralis]|uniref:Uncharacterized protein n=1 Tax=Saccharobesus litoralis TaxID=2172099 RepID=A0A2S0VVQ6_9ALTE|nr:hypothetical protein [Saccharobesus litoralis]AWB68263.1 hypothetical protein C2869_18405 [Saccharobesus litoralis]